MCGVSSLRDEEIDGILDRNRGYLVGDLRVDGESIQILILLYKL